MNRVAKRAGAVILLVVVLLAGITFFVAEFVTQAGAWAVFPGSPHIYNGNSIATGAVVDREGVLLLDMNGSREYSSSQAVRKATLHWVGDIRGNISAPALPEYSSQIVGFDLLNGLYSYGGAGSVAELTLSSQAQTVALEAMGGYKGTVAVYNYKTGELLCAVTTPTFDPLDEPDVENDPQGLYEGVYMNRFTQSAYTPGSIFKIVTLAAALEHIPDVEQQEFVCSGQLLYGADKITCENVHGSQSLKQAFCNSCNCAFAQLSGLLGQELLQQQTQKLLVTQPVSFDGITTVRGNYEAPAEPVNLAWSAIGQYTDLVNPCRFMTLMGAIANGGQGVTPYVVAKAGDGLSGYEAQTQYDDRVLSTEISQTIKEYMRNNVQSKYGDDNFPGLSVCAKTGTAEKDGDAASNAMLAGFVDSEEYPLAFIVCVEGGGYGASTCIPIASQVLQACKTALDS